MELKRGQAGEDICRDIEREKELRREKGGREMVQKVWKHRIYSKRKSPTTDMLRKKREKGAMDRYTKRD